MKYKNAKSDEDLFILCQQDDEEAFSQIYERYWQGLIKKSLHKLHNQSDTEEVVQNVFVNLWKWKENIKIKGPFKYYIYTMLRNEIFRFLEQRIRQSSQLQLEDISIKQIPFSNDDMRRIELVELQDNIDSIIEGLPEKCKLIFRMSRDEGMTAKQIADQLDISHRTVETQISKAIKTLKQGINRFAVLLF